MAEIPNPEVSEILTWRPWRIGDPVPDWILNRLDKAAAMKVAAIHLEMSRAIAEAQVKALASMQEVVKGVK